MCASDVCFWCWWSVALAGSEWFQNTRYVCFRADSIEQNCSEWLQSARNASFHTESVEQNGPEWLKMASKCFAFTQSPVSRMAPNGSKRFQNTRNICFHANSVEQNGSDWLKMAPACQKSLISRKVRWAEWLKMAQNRSKMVQNCWKWFRVDQNSPDKLKIAHTNTEFFKITQKELKMRRVHPNCFQMGPKARRLYKNDSKWLPNTRNTCFHANSIEQNGSDWLRKAPKCAESTQIVLKWAQKPAESIKMVLNGSK